LTVANSKYYGCFNSIMFLCGKQSNETVAVHPVKTLLSIHIKITVCLWSPFFSSIQTRELAETMLFGPFLGDIADKRFRLQMLSSRGLFMHCAQTAEDIDTISFAYDSPMSLPDRIITWLIHRSTPFNFCSKVTHPLLIWASTTFDGIEIRQTKTKMIIDTYRQIHFTSEWEGRMSYSSLLALQLLVSNTLLVWTYTMNSRCRWVRGLHIVSAIVSTSHSNCRIVQH